jgi:hypothetical protein
MSSQGLPNKYNVLVFGSSLRRQNFVDVVDLTSSNHSLPPNPRYLALHCAICKVLWACGRGEELEEFMRDIDDTTVLAEDGSSAKLFEFAIQRSLTAINRSFVQSNTSTSVF